MKRFFAFLLLFSFLCAHTEARQLFRLPLLVKHFYKHKTEDHQTSLASFLKMHYWEKEMNDTDEEEDNQLPFKQAPEKIAQQVFIQQAFISDPVHIVIIQQKKIIYNNIILPGIKLNIFHPPRP